VENVAATVGHALVCLDAHPENRQRLRASSAQLIAAREEFIRYFSPAQLLARTVTRDLAIAGENLASGERVLLSWASANHDPAAFDHPRQIIIDRQPSRHLAFGVD
jgi:cytochrome P450